MNESKDIKLTDRELALATHGLATLQDTRAANEMLRAALSTGYPEPDDAQAWARLRSQGILGPGAAAVELPAGVTAEPISVEGIDCLSVAPAGGTPTGTYVHLHGGGWSLGSAARSVGPLAELVADTGLRAVSVEYPLAPEHHLDAIVDTCVRVARGLAREPGFIAIGGESAGAHLAVLVLLRLRDEGATPFRAAVLTYGVYDLAGTPGRLAGPRAREVARLAEVTLGTGDPAVLRSARHSPLYAPLDGMPPARFLCGTRDSLLEDTLMMHARWSTVVDTELDLVAGADHGFTLVPGTTTRATRAREAAYLRRAVAGFERGEH